jgi:heme oxygenase (mycobilin-producing)
MAEPVVLINAFEVPAANAEAFIAGWETIRDYLRNQPGYVDTTLHQAITPDAEYRFVNVAHWATPGDFMAAVRSPGFEEVSALLADYPSHPALYQTVRR